MQDRLKALKSWGYVLVSLVGYRLREEPVRTVWVIEASKEDLVLREWMADRHSAPAVLREADLREADLSEEGQMEEDLVVAVHEARKDYSPYSEHIPKSI